MGYTDQWRERVTSGSLVGYTRNLQKGAKGEAKRNKIWAEALTNRRFKSLVGAEDCFRLEVEEDALKVMPPTGSSPHTGYMTTGTLKVSCVCLIPLRGH